MWILVLALEKGAYRFGAGRARVRALTCIYYLLDTNLLSLLADLLQLLIPYAVACVEGTAGHGSACRVL